MIPRAPRLVVVGWIAAVVSGSSLPARAQGESQGRDEPPPESHEGVTVHPAPPTTGPFDPHARAPSPRAQDGATSRPAPPQGRPLAPRERDELERHEGVTITELPLLRPAPSSSSTPASASPGVPPAARRSTPPRAEPPRAQRPRDQAPGLAARFGDRGTVVLVGGASFGLAYSPQQRTHVAHAFDLGAALEVFPFRHVSFGTVLSIAYDHYLDGERTLGFGVVERAGYVFALAPRLTFWPRAGLAASREVREGGLDPGHATAIFCSAYLPLQIEPVPHVLVGLGPEVRVDLRQRLDGMERPRGGRLGLSTEVVAWF